MKKDFISMKREVSKLSEQIMEDKPIDFNKSMGLHDIKEALSKPLGKQLIDNLKLDWIFDKWYEKLIVAGSFLFAIFTIFKFLIGLIK